ncbi:AEC family transporter [Sulfurimonas sp.]|uniref:AEC family transporter n=1 Tax=Sulfurimonas sp. TaxID=2022749 RepID=UPI0026296D45|nr:AEC family transporter [Sulfurimonas sp.]
MSSIIFSIYLFIIIGYIAKRSFKEQIDDKTITLLNVYFLQVFLTFWGLLLRPIDITLFYAPFVYLIIILIALMFSALFAKKFFHEKKEHSIAVVAALIGNTANLGIPLNIAIFGEASIPYTTIVNLMNIFVVYTIGVYFYSRGTFSVAESLKNVLKLPILWAALMAIGLSLYGYRPNKAIMNMLMMGAYASITMQLILFGIYLYGTKVREINRTLISWVISFKFLLLPTLAFVVLSFLELDSMIKGIIFIELLTPLAIANVNLSSLYDCEPKIVTALVFITSLLFLGVIFVGVKLLHFL